MGQIYSGPWGLFVELAAWYTNRMKLIIQIPCYNEAETLPHTLQLLPRAIEGVDEIEVLVIDDGSQDGTSEVARAAGVQHVVTLRTHSGLAFAFAAGLNASLEAGADWIVNTDADNQYEAADIPTLLQPLLRGEADLVVGDRGVATQPYFRPLKRRLQTWGSRVVSGAAGFQIPDATSGFRAFTRAAAQRTIILSEYSYTLETLIQAGQRHLRVVSVPIRTNPPRRPSRLMRGTVDYLLHSSVTILRAYAMYRPIRVFFAIGGSLIVLGMIPLLRFLYYYFFVSATSGKLQSLLLGALLVIIGFQTLLIGLLADLVGFNRKILEEVLLRLRQLSDREG